MYFYPEVDLNLMFNFWFYVTIKPRAWVIFLKARVYCMKEQGQEGTPKANDMKDWVGKCALGDTS